VSAILLYNTLPSSGPAGGRVNPDSENLPVLGITNELSLDLLQRASVVELTKKPLLMKLQTYTHFKHVITKNVIADTPQGDEKNIIVAGSHLDSVSEGPGINDDGSGAGMNLEVAIQLYKTGLSKSLVNKVRFAWWSAEELGNVFYY
jgi:hypothetical protein